MSQAEKPAADADVTGTTKSVSAARRAAAASFVGTAIEWYDFYIYGMASALVFGPLFFPGVSPAAGMIASFATFWVGFLARPLGGIVFGHFGDRYGRKATLVTTLLLTGIGTFLIGLLPGYDQIGVAAPVLLALLRAVQGVAVGGEWGGAVALMSEKAPEGRRSMYTMMVQQGAPAGSIVATLAFLAVGGLPHEALVSWGWRLPFLFSLVLVVVALFIRLRIEETEDFTDLRRRGEVSRLPIVEVLRTAWPTVLLGIGASIIGISSAFFNNTFVLSWATTSLGVSNQAMLYVLLLASILQFVWQPFAAIIAQRVGDARVMTIGLIANIVVVVPMFLLISTGNPALIFLGMAPSVIASTSYYAVLAGFLARAFPTRTRYTGISLSYQLCSAAIGGTTPLIAQSLLTLGGGAIWPVALFYCVLLVATVASVVALSVRTARLNRPPRPESVRSAQFE